MKILKASDRVKLMQLLDLPSGAHQIYEDLAGTFYGETFEDVARFALISWLHDHHRVVFDALKDRDETIRVTR